MLGCEVQFKFVAQSPRFLWLEGCIEGGDTVDIELEFPGLIYEHAGKEIGYSIPAAL